MQTSWTAGTFQTSHQFLLTKNRQTRRNLSKSIGQYQRDIEIIAYLNWLQNKNTQSVEEYLEREKKYWRKECI